MWVMLLSNVSATVITHNLSCLDVTEWDLLFFCPGDKQTGHPYGMCVKYGAYDNWR